MDTEAWKENADPAEFWAMVDLARRDYAAFIEALKEADRRRLIRFTWWFEYYQSTLRDEPYVDTGDPALSEDRLDDLADEVVGKGKAFYDDVLANPGRMPEEADFDDPAHDMQYDVIQAYAERYGEAPPPYGHDY
jgi:hypothetical protein